MRPCRQQRESRRAGAVPEPRAAVVHSACAQNEGERLACLAPALSSQSCVNNSWLILSVCNRRSLLSLSLPPVALGASSGRAPPPPLCLTALCGRALQAHPPRSLLLARLARSRTVAARACRKHPGGRARAGAAPVHVCAPRRAAGEARAQRRPLGRHWGEACTGGGCAAVRRRSCRSSGPAFPPCHSCFGLAWAQQLKKS